METWNQEKIQNVSATAGATCRSRPSFHSPYVERDARKKPERRNGWEVLTLILAKTPWDTCQNANLWRNVLKREVIIQFSTSPLPQSNVGIAGVLWMNQHCVGGGARKMDGKTINFMSWQKCKVPQDFWLGLLICDFFSRSAVLALRSPKLIVW